MFSQTLRSEKYGFAERERESIKLVSNFRAQGTIEYLVIIAVVIVLSLVVVGLIITQIDNSSQVSSSGNQLGLKSQVIGITESLIDPNDGNFVVSLLNNSGDVITVSNVSVGDRNVAFSEDLAQGSSKLFKVVADSNCTLGKVVSSDVIITYVTRDGLTKTVRYPSQVMFACSPFVIAQANLLANQCPSCGSTCSGGSQSLSASSVSVAAGCYTATDLNVVDTDLAPANILTGTTIFGVVGSASAGSSVPLYANLGSGQTTCYDEDSTETCPVSGYPGQDAERYGSSYTHVWGSATAGTILDLNTNLRWQIADMGHNDTWANALIYCDTLSLDGYSDWYLPTMKEVSDIYDYLTGTCNSVFSACGYYWSSTSVPAHPYTAYGLYIDYGTIFYDNKDYDGSYRARCVRFES